MSPDQLVNTCVAVLGSAQTWATAPAAGLRLAEPCCMVSVAVWPNSTVTQANSGAKRIMTCVSSSLA